MLQQWDLGTDAVALAMAAAVRILGTDAVQGVLASETRGLVGGCSEEQDSVRLRPGQVEPVSDGPEARSRSQSGHQQRTRSRSGWATVWT